VFTGLAAVFASVFPIGARQAPMPAQRSRTVYAVSGGEISEVDKPGLFSISGHVVDSHDQAAAARCASFMSAEDGLEGNARTQLDGSFRVKNLAPGRHVVEVGPCNDPGDRIPSGAEGAVTTVVIDHDHLQGLVIRTHRSVTVHGHVRFDPATADPRRPRVHLLAELAVDRMGVGAARHAAVSDDGTFTFSSLIGPRVIRFGMEWPGRDSPWYPGPVLLAGRDVTNVPVAFESETDPELEVVFNQIPTGLRGVVIDEAGLPVSNAYVLVFSSDVELWQQWSSTTNVARSDENGQFFLIGPPGRYLAVAFPEDAFDSGVDAVKDFGALARLAQPVEFVEGKVRFLSLTTRNRSALQRSR